jgi:prepilin-type N-terminal cleavage/methylation domain-containing protein
MRKISQKKSAIVNSSFRRRAGFSLFEIIIVVAIFATMISAVAKLKNTTELMQEIVGQKMTSGQDIEQVLQIMSSEIRAAGPSALGAYPIESASTSSFVFFSDVDRDGVFERIRYFLETSTIRQGIIKPTGTPAGYPPGEEIFSLVTDNVIISSTTPLFAYFDSAYTGTQTSSLPLPIEVTKIRTVKINIYRDTKPGTAPAPSLFTAEVTLRNLRSY